jgi:hypothetical protein
MFKSVRHLYSIWHRLTREVLLKEKAQYSLPPSTNQFSSAPFNNENIITLCYKTSYLNEKAICTEPSSLLVFPGLADCLELHPAKIKF